MKIPITVLGLVLVYSSMAQDVKVEYDKTKDYSAYKTFRFGESEIVTPKDKKQITDTALRKIIQEAIEKELGEKGITKDDSSKELVVTYVAGIFEHSERQNLGPLGTAPGQSSQTWMNNYSQGELIIDVNDVKSNKLIWRINSQTNTSTPEAESYIDQVVDKGLKKFAVKPKSQEEQEVVVMYRFIIRPVLFWFDPEAIHHFTFRFLKGVGFIPGATGLIALFYQRRHPSLKQTLFGLDFQNPVGLAAGFDKDAKLIDELAAFGFAFIEIGTLTPKPQPGNDKPRLFRLPSDQAIINRMGFNNEGVEAAVSRLRTRKSNVIVGGNIGKNKVTANEEAFNDYAQCLKVLDPYVDYFVVNVSSPNTPGLRALQEKEPLRKLMGDVKELSLQQTKPKPVLLKIAPDLTNEQLDDIIDILKSTETDGVIATNTTISRDGLKASSLEVEKIGNGGLSGKPLTKRSTEVIQYLRKGLGPDFPIIGVGGIMSAHDAVEKIKAGANLIQLYTGFIYSGPSIVRQINKALKNAIS